MSRKLTTFVLVTYVVALASPILEANVIPPVDDPAAWRARAEESVALQQTLAAQYQQAVQRQRALQARMQELQSTQPIHEIHFEALEAEKSRIRDTMAQNQAILDRSGASLGRVQTQIKSDYDTVSRYRHPGLADIAMILGSAVTAQQLIASQVGGEAGAAAGGLFGVKASQTAGPALSGNLKANASAVRHAPTSAKWVIEPVKAVDGSIAGYQARPRVTEVVNAGGKAVKGGNASKASSTGGSTGRYGVEVESVVRTGGSGKNGVTVRNVVRVDGAGRVKGNSGKASNTDGGMQARKSDTGGSAAHKTTRYAKGVVRPPEGLSAAEQQVWLKEYLHLKRAEANINRQLQKTSTSYTNAAKRSDTTGQEILQNRRADLKAKKSDIAAEIKAMEEGGGESQSKSQSGGAKAIARSAATWALWSAGITVGAGVISQLQKKGWNPDRVDWGEATAPLRELRFWTGTGGAWLGAYSAASIAAALIPGAGPVLSSMIAIGGAQVGWQAGTGQLAQTDWLHLGVTTVGAALGAVLASAMIPPFGAMIGGYLGYMAASFLLDLWRDATGMPTEAYYASDDYDTAAPGDWAYDSSGSYATLDSSYGDGGTLVPGSTAAAYGLGDASGLGASHGSAYNEVLATQKGGVRDQAKLEEIYQRYKQEDQALHSLQGQAKYSDFSR